MAYVEYIQIFITLVLGLAFTRIISSHAIIIKNASRVKFYWPYYPISIGLLVFVINDFWTGYERSKFLTIGSGLDLKLSFVVALITPLSYTIVAELLHPKISDEKGFDMQGIVAARRTAYILGVANIVYALVSSLVPANVSASLSAQLIRLGIATIFIVGIFSKNEWVQKIIAVLFFMMAIVWFLFENSI